jgi:hypothetical protein
MHLWAPGINVTMDETGSLGTITIPTAGRLLYEDNRDPAPAAGAQPGTAPAATADTGVRGKIGISWGKSMIYDPTAKQAVLEGDVAVVHQQPKQDSVWMKSRRLIADFEAAAGSKSQQLKQVRAEGGVKFKAKTMSFDAAEATYDPGNDRVTARGVPGQPVQVQDDNNVSTGSFDELWWNLKTNQAERMKNGAGSIQR